MDMEFGTFQKIIKNDGYGACRHLLGCNAVSIAYNFIISYLFE